MFILCIDFILIFGLINILREVEIKWLVQVFNCYLIILSAFETINGSRNFEIKLCMFAVSMVVWYQHIGRHCDDQAEALYITVG